MPPLQLSRLARATAAALLFVAGACTEPTGPETPPVTLVETGLTAVEFTLDANDDPIIICDYSLKLSAAGTATVFWNSIQFRMFDGIDRSAPVWTETIIKDSLQAFIGLTDFQATREHEFGIRGRNEFPFVAEMIVSYTMNGRARTATRELQCGPQPAANVAPPSIDAVYVVAPTDLHAGDTIVVSANASSAYGLWETILRVSGPFDDQHRFGESARLNTSRTWRFVVPDSARLDVPLVVTTIVRDPAGRLVRKDSTTTHAMRDIAPPVLTGVSFTHQYYGGYEGLSDRQLSRYDRLVATIRATDDLGLRWAILELDAPSPVRDSIALVPGASEQRAIFQVQATWAGASRATVHVVDRKGRRSVAQVASAADSIRFFPFLERPVARIDLPIGRGDAVHDPVRNRFYFTDEQSNSLRVIDAATMSLLPAIPIGAPVQGIEASITGDSLFLAIRDAGQIGIVDLRGVAPVVTFREALATPAGGGAPVRAHPYDLRRDAAGRLVVLGYDEAGAYDGVVLVDLAASTMHWLSDGDPGTSTAVSNNALRLVVADDRTRLWGVGGGCSRDYRSSNATIGTCRNDGVLGYTTGTAPGVSPDGTTLAVHEAFYDANLVTAAIAPIIRYGWYRHLRWSPNGNEVWAADDWLYDRIRMSDRVRLERLGLPIRPRQTWQDPAGQFLFVYAIERNAFIRVDLR